MIHGIGIDIVDVQRLEQAIRRWGERFVERVFTPEEIKYCSGKASPYNSYAARFAAKEAFIKALKASEHIPFKEIGVMNKDTGQPEIRLYGNAGALFAEIFRNGRIYLSLSHDRGCSIASVVIEVNGS
ncbi:Holo-[acyl-carrier-protein] synthase [hydrothermal vent metagenome]|uniref:Holo-[acyl-carrier-protein] synthase n=1 Tax=hydrothermal vent metagenome TaxID=652676 RepID=A0A3B1CVE0_9ZZZZ